MNPRQEFPGEPTVSVVMGVYNAEEFAEEAVKSVLDQTFTDFEFIVVDDGSTDASGEVVRSFHDERIVLVENGTNVGLTRSLNRGLEIARGEFIVRQDADDVSLPTRLERQVDFLTAHPEVGLVGCAVEFIGPSGERLGVQRVHREPIDRLLTHHNWFNHSATAFRQECLERVGSYRETFRYAQDHDLWLRIAEKYEVACMAEPLVRIRFNPDSISALNKTYQRAYSDLAVELAQQRRETGQDVLEQGGASDLGIDHRLDVTPEALAMGSLRTACLHYLVGDVTRAQDCLQEAVRQDPHLLERTDQVLDQILGFGFGYGSLPGSNAGVLRFVDRVFANLPPCAAELAQLGPRAMSRVYVESAFDSYQAGDWSRVRRDLPRAISLDASWLRNRGVWSILLQSFGLGRGSDADSPPSERMEA
jgi:tetratricopeptide (TPR) repeat protein